MGTALRSGNEVHVALGDKLAAIRQPLHGPVNRFLVAGNPVHEWFRRQAFPAVGRLSQVVLQTVFVIPGPLLRCAVLITIRLVAKEHLETRAEHGLGAQKMPQSRAADLGGIEILRIRPKAHGGPRVALADRADVFELGHFIAAGEAHSQVAAVAADLDLELRGKRIDHRHANTMEATGELIVVAVELTSRMQSREDQLHA